MPSEMDSKKTNIILSPEIRRIRNAVIKKFADEPLDIMAKFVKDVVDNEKDTVKRLGAMAARVQILRMRISEISEKPYVEEDDIEAVSQETEHGSEDTENPEIVVTNPNLADWVRLRIVENSEINGVRFPKGVVIDVSQEDGERLLEAGKAEYTDEDDLEDVKANLKQNKKLENDVSSQGEENVSETLDATPEKTLMDGKDAKPEAEGSSEQVPETSTKEASGSEVSEEQTSKHKEEVDAGGAENSSEQVPETPTKQAAVSELSEEQTSKDKEGADAAAESSNDEVTEPEKQSDKNKSLKEKLGGEKNEAEELLSGFKMEEEKIKK